MEIGIVGLPKSGKTTVFNALTRGKAQTSAFTSGAEKPNLGVAKVPDPRLTELEQVFKPKKTVPAEVKYVDLPGTPKGLGKTEGIGGQFLSDVAPADALLHVVRSFEDERVPHPEGKIDPHRDVATMNTELAFADLAFLEKRLERLKSSLKVVKPQERDPILKEQALLARIKSSLEQDIPLREQQLSPEEHKLLENYQFLTSKPLLIALNIGEGQLPQVSSLEEDLGQRYRRPGVRTAVLCGKLEMELGELEDGEAKEFRVSLGLSEAWRDQMIRLSYELLGYLTFFTTASAELRAWPLRRSSLAPQAAGKVHTDMERGFIRAEVIGYDDLLRCGSIAEARKRGLLRLEGKGYLVHDGDIITFLFNV